MPVKRTKVAHIAASDTDNDEGELPMMNDSYLKDYEEAFRESDIEDSFKKPSKEKVKDGDFVLLKYCSKRTVSHFVGVALQEPNEEDLLEVEYLVRKQTKTKSAMSVFREKDDIDEIDFMDIILKMSKPITASDTKLTVQ